MHIIGLSHASKTACNRRSRSAWNHQVDIRHHFQPRNDPWREAWRLVCCRGYL